MTLLRDPEVSCTTHREIDIGEETVARAEGTVPGETDATVVAEQLARLAAGAVPGVHGRQATFEDADVVARGGEKALSAGERAFFEAQAVLVDDGELRLEAAVWDGEEMLVEGEVRVPCRSDLTFGAPTVETPMMGRERVAGLGFLVLTAVVVGGVTALARAGVGDAGMLGVFVGVAVGGFVLAVVGGAVAG